MSELYDKSLQKLELDRVLSMLAECCRPERRDINRGFVLVLFLWNIVGDDPEQRDEHRQQSIWLSIRNKRISFQAVIAAYAWDGCLL